MSNFSFKAKNIRTGHIVEVDALDDYFGKHHYGYQIDGRIVITEERYKALFEEVKKGLV